MFLGSYEPKMDDKGRLILPAKFRDQLAGEVRIVVSMFFPPPSSSGCIRNYVGLHFPPAKVATTFG